MSQIVTEESLNLALLAFTDLLHEAGESPNVNNDAGSVLYQSVASLIS